MPVNLEYIFDNDTVGTGCFSYLPGEFVWACTNVCNLKCKHCSLDSGKPWPDELTTEEGKKLIYDIWKYFGPVKFAFTGGEPLMREDIFELIKFAFENTKMQIVMATNGTLLTKKNIERLLEAGMWRVGVSIDGVGKKHDELRGIPGCFDEVYKNLKLAKEMGLRFQFHSTISKLNVDEVPKIIDLAEELGAYRIYFVFLITTGRGKNLDDLSWQEAKELAEYLYERQKTSKVWLKPICNPCYTLFIREKMEKDYKNKKINVYPRVKPIGCPAGITRFHFLPNGDIWPCAYVPMKVGNVRKGDLYDLLINNPYFKAIKLARGYHPDKYGFEEVKKETLEELKKKFKEKYGFEPELKGICKDCKFKKECGGCRARAYAKYNDFLAEDIMCYMNNVEN